MLKFTKCVLFTLTLANINLAKGALLAVTLPSRVCAGHPGVKVSSTKRNMVSDICRLTLYLSFNKTPESDLERK